MKNHELYRRITHTEYKGLKKIGDKGPQSWLRKIIDELDEIEYRKYIGDKGETVNDRYIKISPHAHIWPRNLGGFALFMAAASSFIMLSSESTKEDPEYAGLISLVISLSILALCIIYYYTMPKKEIIFDRMHGTITFPGWLWSKNIVTTQVANLAKN